MIAGSGSNRHFQILCLPQSRSLNGEPLKAVWPAAPESKSFTSPFPSSPSTGEDRGEGANRMAPSSLPSPARGEGTHG